MNDEQKRQRLARLVEAIGKENSQDQIHGSDAAELYELGAEPDEGVAVPDIPRYLGCTSEGHWESTYRDNPDFHVGTAKEVEDWLASGYVEGWAGRWVIDLETGDELSWSTDCKFEQEVDRETEPGYTVVGIYLEDNGPHDAESDRFQNYATSVYTFGGPKQAAALAQKVCREDNDAETGEDMLQIVAVIAGEHNVLV